MYQIMFYFESQKSLKLDLHHLHFLRFMGHFNCINNLIKEQ